MPARKCRRTCAPPAVPDLPACLLLEIAARTDAVTIFRCAATCKLLRREILSADFVRRVCQGPDAVVPSRTLGVLADSFSLLHPVTTATVTLERHLAPFMSRSGSIAAAGLLEQYRPLTSHNGLVVLRRLLGSERGFADDLCVYDPMTNSRAFLPLAPDIGWDPCRGLGDVHLIDQCALLTAADGIGCAFMLVAADMARNNLDCMSSARVRVQTVSSSDSFYAGGATSGWGAVKTSERHPCPRWCTNRDRRNDAAVVVAGGVVHWLIHCGMSSSSTLQGAVGEYILTYDVNAAAVGSVDVPKDRRLPDLQREPALPSRLASSPDRKLSFVVADHCAVLVWVLMSVGSWARQVQIDMKPVWGSMLQPWMDPRVELESVSGPTTKYSAAVFLRIGDARFVLDMETGATTCPTCLRGEVGIPYQVDLASRLASMKSF